MIIILIGASLFLGIHLLSLKTTMRTQLIAQLGLVKYKLIYSLFALTGLLMLFVARFQSGGYIKDGSLFFFNNRDFLLLIATILIVSADIPGNHIRKTLRHPMLLGIIIWSFTHFMMNQHLNHLIFFASFFFFSIIMLVGIIIRDKNIQRPKEIASTKKTVIATIAGIIVFSLIVYFHKFIAGYPLV